MREDNPENIIKFETLPRRRGEGVSCVRELVHLKFHYFHNYTDFDAQIFWEYVFNTSHFTKTSENRKCDPIKVRAQGKCRKFESSTYFHLHLILALSRFGTFTEKLHFLQKTNNQHGLQRSIEQNSMIFPCIDISP